MTKTKKLLAALALTTALTAPALVAPMLITTPAIAGEATHDFADLAAKVTPAVVNVAVTMKAAPVAAASPRALNSSLSAFNSASAALEMESTRPSSSARAASLRLWKRDVVF